IVHAAEVQSDAQTDGEELHGRQPDAKADSVHGRADNGIGFDARAPEGDADVGEDAVERLHDEERQNGEIAEPAPRFFPSSVQMFHASTTDPQLSAPLGGIRRMWIDSSRKVPGYCRPARGRANRRSEPNTAISRAP